MARESGVKVRAVRAIRESGRYAVRIAASHFQTAGLPDVLVLLRHPRGRALWLEFKQPGETPTRLQAAKMRELDAAGAATAVVHSVSEALTAVRDAEDH